MRRLALFAVMLGLVAGCGGPVAGQPTAAPTDRPRDIRLDAIDPCSLFPPAVRQELGITRPLKFYKALDPVYHGETPSCGGRIEGPPQFSVRVTFGLLDGIELFSPDRVAGTLTPKRVQGFPALLLKPSKYSDNCGMIVDTGQAQSISAIYSDEGNKPPVAQDELCARVEHAANLTVAELLRQP